MRVIPSIILTLAIFATADAQQNPIKDEGKKKTGINKPSGNPGDPNNAFKGQQQQKDTAAHERATQQADDNDQSLLGDDNDKARAEKGDSRGNYRSNRVSGNPNNRSTAEGSNRRRAAMGESDESSRGTVSSDSTSMSGRPAVEDFSEGGSISNPQSSNVPAVSQESTSGSGSPAILSGEEGTERDGTNNVQRAKPNMAGSPVGNLKSGKRDIDPDSEIKEGTDKQQRSAATKAFKQTRPGKKVSAGMSQQNEEKPNVATDSQNAVQRQEAASGEGDNYTDVTKQEPARVDKKSERKAKRKKRRNN